MNRYNENYYAVIMAGGVGSRFWPVSRVNHPKQFQDIMGVGETMLQLTFNRLASIVLPENILILTNDSYKEIVQEQLPKLSKDQIILEPEMKNTAPCILMAALKIKKENPDAVMLVAPSDHWIVEKDRFIEDVNKAFGVAAKEDILVTLGIQPTFPNTGYGYIKYDKEEDLKGEKAIFKVRKFAEKPTLRNAKLYLQEGNYIWNAGIFIWKASVIVDSFKEHSKEIFDLFNKGIDFFNEEGEDDFVREIYPKARSISVDYAILERSENVYVIPASFDWDDLGTWGALYSRLAKDDNKNAVVNAKLMPVESKANMVYTPDHKVVVVDGLENYIIIDTDDVLMIVPKQKEQDIKNLRESAMEKYGKNMG